jgi:hypothetical protein
MKNLVQFKNFIEPLIEEFEQSNYFQELNVETQKNANLFVTNFVKHVGNYFTHPIDLKTWKGEDLLEVYKLSYLAFDWQKKFENEENENSFFIPQIEQAKNSIVAFLQFLGVQKQEIPNVLESIDSIDKEHEEYTNNYDGSQKIVFMLNGMFLKGISKNINIYDENTLQKFIKEEIEILKTINKYDVLVEKYGYRDVFDKMSFKEQSIVLKNAADYNEITSDNIDITLGKKLQLQVALMHLRGASSAELEQFNERLSELEQRSLFYVIQQEHVEDIPKSNNRLITVGPKIGRNDPCSCGSGKKYKKCCG